MRRLTLLVMTIMMLRFGVGVANAFLNGGFEDDGLNLATAPITANLANSEKWWYGQGENSNTWLIQEIPVFAAEGSKFAGMMSGDGLSGGLLQIVPITDEKEISLSFKYLPWSGDYDSTTGSYAVYGFQGDEDISLGINGPGIGTELFSGDLDGVNYDDFGSPPKDNYYPISDSIDIGLYSYQYIGVWFQYNTPEGGSFFLDDVQLTVTSAPEPGTVGLLGLGSLILFLRRRR